VAGLMSLDDRVLHLPSDVHGVALCGETMRDPWQCGPLRDLAGRSSVVCLDCFEEGRRHGLA